MDNWNTWREFLGLLEPQERQELAEAMGVHPLTLVRWASGGNRENRVDRDKSPRPQTGSLRKFIASLPIRYHHYRDALIASIGDEFPDLTAEDFQLKKLSSMEEIPVSIPAICYEQVLEAAAASTGDLRFQTVFDYILDFLLKQLDPERLGLYVLMAQCTQPPPGDSVKSLRERFAVGTHPWRRGDRTYFMGAESLAGQAVQRCASYTIDDLRSYNGILPAHAREYAVSVAASPIQSAGKVAGCLMAMSTLPNYFTQERMKLLKRYCHLAAVAFADPEFYCAADIALSLLPEAEKQEPLLLLFPKYVERLMLREKITRPEAEWRIFLEMEENLIFLSSATKEKGLLYE